MTVRKKGRINPEDIEDEGPIELSPEDDARAQEAIAQADAELGREARFSCRWTIDALNLIKHVAEAMGVPYQTYIKQASYRCALEDLARMHSAVSGQMPNDSARLEQLAKDAAASLPEFAGLKYMDELHKRNKSSGLFVNDAHDPKPDKK